jgi:hypothetical protein
MKNKLTKKQTKLCLGTKKKKKNGYIADKSSTGLVMCLEYWWQQRKRPPTIKDAITYAIRENNPAKFRRDFFNRV